VREGIELPEGLAGVAVVSVCLRMQSSTLVAMEATTYGVGLLRGCGGVEEEWGWLWAAR
jgi:hypothetical protein